MIKFVAGIIVGVIIVLILLLVYGADRAAEDKEKENELLLLRIEEYQKRVKELENERKETEKKDTEHSVVITERL